MIDTEEPKKDEGLEESLSRALAAIVRHVEEIRKQIDRLLSIRLDRARLKLHDWVQWGALSVLLLLVLGSVAIAASLSIVSGVGDALTLALGGREWAGKLAGGLLVLAVVWIGSAAVFRRQRRRELNKLMAKYDRDGQP